MNKKLSKADKFCRAHVLIFFHYAGNKVTAHEIYYTYAIGENNIFEATLTNNIFADSIYVCVVHK